MGTLQIPENKAAWRHAWLSNGAGVTSPGLDPDLLDACVHCGFCLPTCPTYLLWGQEMDSPRGRIYLMRELSEGEPLGEVMQTHFDRCLGCMACMTACPSGVAYDKLLEVTRVQVEHHTRRSWRDRLFQRVDLRFVPFPAKTARSRGPVARLPALEVGGLRLLPLSYLYTLIGSFALIAFLLFPDFILRIYC